MISLVEDIIRLSRLDEGAEDMEREPVELYGLTEEILRRLTEEAKQAEVQMVLTGEQAEVYGIPRLLEEMIYNLCDNAVKYNQKGGQVSVSVKKEGEGVCVAVSDTGIGIPDDCRERIFERFYRGQNAGEGGIGIGLALAKEMIERQNGTIRARNRPEGGALFEIRFYSH